MNIPVGYMKVYEVFFCLFLLDKQGDAACSQQCQKQKQQPASLKKKERKHWLQPLMLDNRKHAVQGSVSESGGDFPVNISSPSLFGQ